MKLQDIRILSDEICENGLNFPFDWSCHHVIELFLHFLPPGFGLNNASVIEINCAGGTERRLVYEEPVLGGCSVEVTGFDFDQYRIATHSEREQIILDLIVDCLLHLCGEQGEDPKEIIDAAALVRNAGFSIVIPLERLSRWSGDRKIQLRVFRHLSAELGESWSAELFYKESGETKMLWLTEHPHYLQHDSHFRKAVFKDGKFFIRSSRENVLEIEPRALTVNRCGWSTPLVKQHRSRRYDQHTIDIGTRAERAASEAGRAFKSGDYATVVAVLGPYEKHISGKNLSRLASAREELRRNGSD